MNRTGFRPARAFGFTVVEVVIVMAVIAVLSAIAFPSYRQYAIRGSRQAAQAQLVELSSIQEKIFLNTNAYTSSASKPYDGTTAGGLGVTGGVTLDGLYTLSVSSSTTSYTITAAPVTGTRQAGDGSLTINSMGKRSWGSKSW